MRWIDTVAGTDLHLGHIPSTPVFAGPARAWRVVPHPAWDQSYQFVAVNACCGGVRSVLVVDLRRLLGAA